MVVTIHDVARRAGVSTSAVSRAINGQPRVSADARQRIQSAIAELGYRPNLQARGLRTAQTRMLGLLVPTLGLPAVAEILQGTSTAAHQQGYLIAISDAAEDPELWAAYLDSLLARQIDGLLCYDSGGIDDLLRPALDAGVPTMILNRAAHDSAATLSFDQRPAFEEAVGHLVREGHQRIALITSPIRPQWREYLGDQLSHLDVAVAPELLHEVESASDARQATETLMALADPPTAIIAVNALNASAVGSQLSAAGYAIPSDVSLISTGESDWTRNGNPPINVVRSPFREGAAASVELLVRHIEGDEGAPGRLILPAEYIRRSSVGPGPGQRPAGAPSGLRR